MHFSQRKQQQHRKRPSRKHLSGLERVFHAVGFELDELLFSLVLLGFAAAVLVGLESLALG